MKTKDKPEFSPEFLEIIALLEQIPIQDPQEYLQVIDLEEVCV